MIRKPVTRGSTLTSRLYTLYILEGRETHGIYMLQSLIYRVHTMSRSRDVSAVLFSWQPAEDNLRDGTTSCGRSQGYRRGSSTIFASDARCHRCRLWRYRHQSDLCLSGSGDGSCRWGCGHPRYDIGHPLADPVVAVPARHAQVRLRPAAGGLQRGRWYVCADGTRPIGSATQ